ncbi:MAG: glycine zipper domain-containing protein [Acidobacteria bacterium]|nr:glycine zipper domain-containing protein [Acidobacteriota bacterium]
MMKRTIVFAALLVIVSGLLPSESVAQTGSQPTGQKTLAATINVFVFPTQGQDSQQQSKDEAECYNWAVGNTGTDPFDLAKQAEQNKQQADKAKEDAKKTGQGAGAQGAVRGAAAGALIGEIANDDAGKGAAYGAAAGMIRGRRKGRQAKQQAEQQAGQQAQQAKAATEQSMGNFKKAFSVCLEAKSYMVKF